MREIRFRGKHVDTNEYIYGVPVQMNDLVFIVSAENRTLDNDNLVKKDTISQYTGMDDSEGFPIWENDRVLVTDKSSMGGVYSGVIKYLEKWGVWGFAMTDADVIETNEFGEHSIGFTMKMMGTSFTLAEAFRYGDESDYTVKVIRKDGGD